MRRFRLRGLRASPACGLPPRYGIALDWTASCSAFLSESIFGGGHASRLARTIDGADFHTGRLCEKLGARSDAGWGNSLLHASLA